MLVASNHSRQERITTMDFSEKIDRIAGFIDRPLWYICYTLMLGSTIVACVLVVMRYIFGTGEVWIDEICRYSFIAMVYLWAGPIVRTGEHIRLDVVTSRLSRRGKDINSLIVNILICAACLTIVVWGISLIRMSMMMGEKSDSFVFSIWWLHAIIAAGMFLQAVYAVLEVLKAIARLSSPKRIENATTEVK
jgi:TRAP-type C4-dicarboxylate transport system permease small subunit